MDEIVRKEVIASDHQEKEVESHDKLIVEEVVFTEQSTGITTDLNFGEVIEDDLSDRTVTESDWTHDAKENSPYNLSKFKDSPELPPAKSVVTFADLLKEAQVHQIDTNSP